MTDRTLTPVERITAAYLRYVRGVEVQDIATAFDVNTGRVSEATSAIWFAAENPAAVRALMKQEEDA